jgi:transcription elongation GreA/GreB family factor
MNPKMNNNSLKEELLRKCSELIDGRWSRIRKVIEDIEISLRSASKNTSGDKHHTERAMLQIERENAGRQLQEIEKIRIQLEKVNINSTSDHVRSGSLATTNHGIFFISISVGSLRVGETNYLGVAPNSPVGLLLLGKKAGDRFLFNQKEYFILEVE